MPNGNKLSFAEREGIKPLPTQLDKKTLTAPLRAALMDVVHQASYHYPSDGEIGEGWTIIFRDMHVHYRGQMPNTFYRKHASLMTDLAQVFEKGTYDKIYGALEFIIRHPSCPEGVADNVNATLQYHHSAYRVVDGDTFVIMGSDEQAASVLKALEELESSQLAGARSHLKESASHLSKGNFADSVRESIHAVESVALAIEPSAELSKALARLEEKGQIHGALKKALLGLYGYSSDEKGIRHSLAFEAEAHVDEIDALFMLGACASFITYLLGKARNLGLKLIPGKKNV